MDEIRYQVFVSSTFTDLKVEREKVLQAILQLRAFPAGMELFPAADNEQFEFIKREIDSSDYYIVIIAGRYGSLSDSGLSFTEMEYDYALSIGKPILAFVARALKPMRGWARAGTLRQEDLEKIALLQDQVIKLKDETARLRESRDTTMEQLASGECEVVWKLNLNDLAFGNAWPTSRDLQVTTTWDAILQSIFSKGSSFVNERDLKRTLLRWISTAPGFTAPSEWFEQLKGYEQANNNWYPNAQSVDRLISDIHRQFTGLSLILEMKETIYVPQPYGTAPVPTSMNVWKLTETGEKRLALTRGFRRS